MGLLPPATATVGSRTLELKRAGEQLIRVDTAPGNRLQPKGGVLERLVCGAWLVLDDLAPGTHVLKLKGYQGRPRSC